MLTRPQHATEEKDHLAAEGLRHSTRAQAGRAKAASKKGEGHCRNQEKGKQHEAIRKRSGSSNLT